MTTRKMVIYILGLAAALPAAAQQPAPPRPRAEGSGSGSPLYWSVNTMLEVYVQQVTRHYNLTPQQQEYTRELLNQRVKSFLADYEKDVRWLAAEMFDYQMKGEIPPPEIAKEWGLRAKQLLPAIREEIVRGNEKWKEVLSDEQREKHARDMKLMDTYFNNLEGRFDRWTKGDVRPSDFEANPDAPRLSHRPRTVGKSEDAWQYYVRHFIQIYNLDEGQQQTAQSILRQLRDEAASYREARKEDFAKLDAAEAKLAKSEPPADPKERDKFAEETRQRMEKRRHLEQPIAGMFERLKRELEKIPTSDQRRARDAQMARLASSAHRSGTRPAMGTTAPASTRPEAAAESPSTLPEVAAPSTQPEGAAEASAAPH